VPAHLETPEQGVIVWRFGEGNARMLGILAEHGPILGVAHGGECQKKEQKEDREGCPFHELRPKETANFNGLSRS